MPPMPLKLQAESGAVSQAQGVWMEYSPAGRFCKAMLCLVGGVGLGAVLIVVPILHLITTWALPLVGVLGAIHILRTEATVREISGTCPACGVALHLQGGRAAFPMRESCPDCRRPLTVARALEA